MEGIKEQFEHVVHELLPEENYITFATHPETGEKMKVVSISKLKSFFQKMYLKKEEGFRVRNWRKYYLNDIKTISC